MITIFRFFCKKLAFLSKTNVAIKILPNLPFLSQKREIFSPKKFAKKIKNHNNGS
jgi:hypothetical protein